MLFTITHLTGSRAGSTQQIQSAVITVGRDPGNSLSFDPTIDAKVSGFHANLTVQGGQVVLTDLGSSNGTFFNGQQIQSPVPLISGANVQFGEGGPIVSVQFAAVAAGGAPAAASGAPAAGGAPPGAAPGAAAVAAGGAAPGAAPAAAPGATPAAAPGATPAAAPAAAPAAGAAPAAAAGGAPDAAGDAPGTGPNAVAKKEKAPSRVKALAVSGAVGLLCLTCLLGAAAYMVRDKLPQGVTRILMRVPVVGKLFRTRVPRVPGQNLVPGGARRLIPKGGEKHDKKAAEGETQGTGAKVDEGDGEGDAGKKDE